MLALPENYDDGLLWQGRLEPASDVDVRGLFSSRAADDPPVVELERELRDLPEVSIGVPNVWNINGIDRSDQIRPMQPGDYYLIKLACSLRPQRKRQSVEWARFDVTLSPDNDGGQPIAVDLHPVSETKTIRRKVALSIAPEVKFHELGAKVAGVESGYEYDELVPMITSFGVQSHELGWEYEQAKGTKLHGDKRMNLLARAPKGSRGCTATFELRADVRIARWRLPVRLLPRRGSASADPLTRELW